MLFTLYRELSQGQITLTQALIYLAFLALGSILATGVHESGHAYAAHLCGDDTSKYLGRISLNPLNHIDPLGTLCLLLFGFGWAKPVLINPINFRSRTKGTVIVALAGVFANFVLGFISCSIYFIIVLCKNTGMVAVVAARFFLFLAQLNVGLIVFNLLPIPPLDGSRIVEVLLPADAAYKYARFSRYSFLVFGVFLVLSRFFDLDILSWILQVPNDLIFDAYTELFQNILDLYGGLRWLLHPM